MSTAGIFLFVCLFFNKCLWSESTNRWSVYFFWSENMKVLLTALCDSSTDISIHSLSDGALLESLSLQHSATCMESEICWHVLSSLSYGPWDGSTSSTCLRWTCAGVSLRRPPVQTSKYSFLFAICTFCMHFSAEMQTFTSKYSNTARSVLLFVLHILFLHLFHSWGSFALRQLYFIFMGVLWQLSDLV